jgi:NADP-dependent aldehyde dehydrogenase
MLDAIAGALEGRRDEILGVTSEETALTVEELVPEFARMVGTLQMFARVVREASWVRAAIDTPAKSPEEAIGPNHDVRRMLMPLGVAAVFGASNFPLAYGVCGGDTASALAAGCPVLVKEHPAHPRTGRLIHETAVSAIVQAGGPPGVLGYVRHEDPSNLSVSRDIVQDYFVSAVGFTGSVGAGLAIDKLAREREVPIPVFAEMGSNNIVFVSGAATAMRGTKIAEQLAASILQRFGQQCTRPGTIVVELGHTGTQMVAHLANLIAASHGRDMLAPWIKDAYERRLGTLLAWRGVSTLSQGATKEGPRGSHACLLSASGTPQELCQGFRSGPLGEETFGPSAVVIRLPIHYGVVLPIGGALTYSVFCDASEVARGWTSGAPDTAKRHSGRIAFNTVPTGVRVAHGMVHGGPYPATNRPDTTAVGPIAIERWCRPVCLQGCPQALLPPELQDSNPLDIMRIVNGEYTRAPLGH